MSEDVRIKNDKFSFHYRVAAFIEQNGKFLIQKIHGYDYYILSGGHVKLGESSTSAIRREVFEEVGCGIDSLKLVCLNEHFYKKDQRMEHWVENYFLIEPDERIKLNNWAIQENDDGKIMKYNFYWLSIDEIKDIDLKPTVIKELIINNKYNEFNYLISE